MILEEILYNLKSNQEKIVYRNQEETVTFGELYNYVKNMYNFLCEKNKENKPVVVYGHKSIYMIASFLACSFSGAAYIPIDKSIPLERVNKIIEQVQPKYIFAIEKLELNCNNILDKAKIDEIFHIEGSNEIVPKLYEKDIYYIIFTSGSTGNPKGVKVTYKNLNSFVNWFQTIITKEKSIILNQASFSFDLSVADLYLALTTGSELVVLEKEVQGNFPGLFEVLKNSNIEIAVMTPSFAELLLLDKSFNENLLHKLNTIYFCGETLLPKTVSNLFKRFPNIRLINSYGPTECTVAVTSIEIAKDMLNETSLPIGKVKEDTKIYIVNDKLELLPDGEIGEIVISGTSVSDGYLGIKTNKFFMFKDDKSYLTGDLGYLKNGFLYYKSRKDNQIKYKSYRIELSDIEENFYKLKYIEKVVVLTKEDAFGKIEKIIAYVKLKENYIKNSVEIKNDFRKILPEYMCPRIKIVDVIPINNNGKTDIQKLKEK